MGKLQKEIGNTINGFKILDVYLRITPNGKKSRKMLIECQNCGAILERCGSFGSLKTAKCKCQCQYLKPKQPRYRDIEHSGKTYHLTDFCKIHGIKISTFRERIERGMSIEEAIQKRFDCECVICGKRFFSRRPNKMYCSPTCRNRAGHRKGKYNIYICLCEYCKQYFFTMNKYQKTCSEKCRQKVSVNARINRYNHLKNIDGYDSSVTLKDLFKRDKGFCKMCGKKLNFRVGKNSNNHPSIDHIKPISKGGTHTWDNVQLLCRGCNIKKGAN